MPNLDYVEGVHLYLLNCGQQRTCAPGREGSSGGDERLQLTSDSRDAIPGIPRKFSTTIDSFRFALNKKNQ